MNICQFMFVSYGEHEDKIELDFSNGEFKNLLVRNVKGKKPLPEKQLKDALKFVEVYNSRIIDKWTDFFERNVK